MVWTKNSGYVTGYFQNTFQDTLKDNCMLIVSITTDQGYLFSCIQFLINCQKKNFFLTIYLFVIISSVHEPALFWYFDVPSPFSL